MTSTTTEDGRAWQPNPLEIAMQEIDVESGFGDKLKIGAIGAAVGAITFSGSIIAFL